MAGLASASPNQRRLNPGGGQAMKLLSLKALIATSSSGQVQEAKRDPGHDPQADADPAGLNHGADPQPLTATRRRPRRRATSR